MPRECYVDRRLLGVERWYVGEPKDARMRVPDIILDCVIYLGLLKPDGRRRILGTAFVVGMPSEVFSDADYPYVVTARHLIEDAKKIGTGEIALFVNRRDGSGVQPVIPPVDGWTFPDDPGSDVAVLDVSIPIDHFRYHTLAHEMCATEEVIAEQGIGPGEDLIVVGLFQHHAGQQQNLPIIRQGIIASMPREPLWDKELQRPYHAYLAELRSIGGLSGSPVFALLPPERLYTGPRAGMGVFTFCLLGLIRSHWEQLGLDSADASEQQDEPLNVGIATVTPITEVIALLEREEFAEVRRRLDRARLDRESGHQVKDSASPVGEGDDEFGRFERLTRKLVQVPKSEVDEARKREDEPA